MPAESPEPSEHVLRQDKERMADGEELDAEGRTAEEIEEEIQASARAACSQAA